MALHSSNTWHDSLCEAVRLPWPLPSILLGLFAFASTVGVAASTGLFVDFLTLRLAFLLPIGVIWISLCLRKGRQRLLRTLETAAVVFNVTGDTYRKVIETGLKNVFSNRVAAVLGGLCFLAGILLQPGLLLTTDAAWTLQFLPNHWPFHQHAFGRIAVVGVCLAWVSAFTGLGVGQVLFETAMLHRILKLKLSVHPVVARYRLRGFSSHHNRVVLVLFGCAALLTATLWGNIPSLTLVIDLGLILIFASCVLIWPQIVFHLLLLRRREEMLAALESKYQRELFSCEHGDRGVPDAESSQAIISTYETLTRAPVWAFDTRLAVELAFFLVVPFLAVFAPEIVKSVSWLRSSVK